MPNDWTYDISIIQKINILRINYIKVIETNNIKNKNVELAIYESYKN